MHCMYTVNDAWLIFSPITQTLLLDASNCLLHNLKLLLLMWKFVVMLFSPWHTSHIVSNFLPVISSSLMASFSPGWGPAYCWWWSTGGSQRCWNSSPAWPSPSSVHPKPQTFFHWWNSITRQGCLGFTKETKGVKKSTSRYILGWATYVFWHTNTNICFCIFSLLLTLYQS